MADRSTKSNGRTLRAKSGRTGSGKGVAHAHTPLTPEQWGPLFLAAYQKTHKVRASAEMVGIDVSTVYRRRDRDPAFAAALLGVQDAIKAAVDDEIYHRAVEGDIDLEPIFMKGDNDETTGEPIVVQVGTRVRVKKSDTMLSLLAKALMPEKYADRSIVYNVDLSNEVRRVADTQNVPPEVLSQTLNSAVKRLMADQAAEDKRSGR